MHTQTHTTRARYADARTRYQMRPADALRRARYLDTRPADHPAAIAATLAAELVSHGRGATKVGPLTVEASLRIDEYGDTEPFLTWASEATVDALNRYAGTVADWHASRDAEQTARDAARRAVAAELAADAHWYVTKGASRQAVAETLAARVAAELDTARAWGRGDIADHVLTVTVAVGALTLTDTLWGVTVDDRDKLATRAEYVADALTDVLAGLLDPNTHADALREEWAQWNARRATLLATIDTLALWPAVSDAVRDPRPSGIMYVAEAVPA